MNAVKKAVAVCGGKKIACRITDNFFERAQGIMFCKKEFVPLLIVFAQEGEKTNALHSFFCPPFDAVFLDGSGKVVEVKKNIAPNSPAIISCRNCKMVLEMPAKQSSGIEAGKKIVFKEHKSA